MKKIILLFALCLFVLSSCTTLNATNNKGIKEENIRKGTDSLSVEFAHGNPPKKIYVSNKDEPFNVLLLLENKGASDIHNGYLSLLTDYDYAEVLDSDLPVFFSLDGKKLQNPNGGSIDESFSFKTKKLANSPLLNSIEISAKFCYDYETLAVATVCIDPDISKKQAGDKICEVKDISLSSQGGPVAVTKIESLMNYDENKGIIPYFTIYVQNKGLGQVINRFYVKNVCSDISNPDDTWNVIDADVLLGDRKLDCSPLPLKLKKNRDFFRCQLTEGIFDKDSAYLSVLKVDLKYGYTITKSKKIDVEQI